LICIAAPSKINETFLDSLETTMRRMLLLLACLIPIGCGNLTTRFTQEWTGIDDPRLLRTCLIEDWGSGVWIAKTERGSYVLTSRDVLGPYDTASVYIVNPNDGQYEEFEARVVASAPLDKESLVLLRVQAGPDFSEPFTTPLAKPFGDGEERKAELMLSTKKKPSAYELPIFEHKKRIGAKVKEGEEPSNAWNTVSRGCMYGGSLKTNRGEPVFQGDALVGVVNESPGMARQKTKDGGEELRVGLTVILPHDVLTFLTRNGYADLVRKP